MFYRQDDAFNILELYVNHNNLFIKRSLHKDIVILQYDVQAKLYDLCVLIQFYQDQRNVNVFNNKIQFYQYWVRTPPPPLAPRDMNNWIFLLTLLL